MLHNLEVNILLKFNWQFVSKIQVTQFNVLLFVLFFSFTFIPITDVQWFSNNLWESQTC